MPDIPLEGQHGARLIPSKKPEESPERRARELEGPEPLNHDYFLASYKIFNQNYAQNDKLTSMNLG